MSVANGSNKGKDEAGPGEKTAFDNLFDSGKLFNSSESEGGSAGKAAQELEEHAPGAGESAWDDVNETVKEDETGKKYVSAFVRDLENRRDPWHPRQTPQGWFDVKKSFLDPFFGEARAVADDQHKVSKDPKSTSNMASSAKDEAYKSINADIAEKDWPRINREAERMLRVARDHAQGTLLLATGLGSVRDIALDLPKDPEDPSKGTAYLASNDGHLYKVDLDTGALTAVASGLGDLSGVALGGDGRAYVTDRTGRRLFSVALSDGTTKENVIVRNLQAYGVGLVGDTAYITDEGTGKLFKVDLKDSQKGPKEIIGDLGSFAAGVALYGNSKAYIGHWNSAESLWEVDLTHGTKRKVPTLITRYSCGIALYGADKAYITDHFRNCLYEVNLVDGARREVVTSTADWSPLGVALDSNKEMIYVGTWWGSLWRISQRAVQGPGAVVINKP